MPDLRLPDFVIIGATKSATTWLSYNLRFHTQIFMPGPELHYFSRWFERGDDWYRAQLAGAGAGQLLGEKSASYLPHPEAAERLHRLLPRAKLLVQLRNPVERAYSDYCMHYRRGEVSRDLRRYLDARQTPVPRLLEDGFYHRHLMRYLGVFPSEQIKILLYDDIRARPGQIFREVCDYLGIDGSIAPQTVAQRVKDKATPVVPPRARRLLAPLKALVGPYRETGAFVAARSLIARQLRYPPLTPELRQRLETHYADDVGRLAELLGRDLSIWRAGGAADATPLEPAPAAPDLGRALAGRARA